MNTNTNGGLSTSPNAHLAVSVEHLSDSELLIGARKLVGRSNQLLAELLACLAEVEARGIHRTRACSSLYTYCIYELRFSEDEAFRRVAASRLVKRFPALLDAVASGELHLTGLLLLGPHLNEQNLAEVLVRAKHRTKREIMRLVRILDPLPAVPARIEPLGPAPARVVPSTPTWEAFIGATCPVRELEPGERPRDWIEDTSEPPTGASFLGKAVNDADTHADRDGGDSAGAHALTGPERYKVQFTATEEYVWLVDEAKALLSHAVPNATLDDIQLRAMRTFVAKLKKQKYASLEPSKTEEAASNEPHARRASPRAAHGAESRAEQAHRHPRQRGRHIPAAVRRAVAMRDGERCTYVDATGRRCIETHRLEFHHLRPFACNGSHAPSNITLRCRAHNALAAEDDFGTDLMEQKNASAAHEPFGR
jgi:hypothetical protein